MLFYFMKKADSGAGKCGLFSPGSSLFKSFLQRICSGSGGAPDGDGEERAKQKSPGKETACSRPAEQ